jgi:hypothetical protein
MLHRLGLRDRQVAKFYDMPVQLIRGIRGAHFGKKIATGFVRMFAGGAVHPPGTIGAGTAATAAANRIRLNIAIRLPISIF